MSKKHPSESDLEKEDETWLLICLLSLLLWYTLSTLILNTVKVIHEQIIEVISVMPSISPRLVNSHRPRKSDYTCQALQIINSLCSSTRHITDTIKPTMINYFVDMHCRYRLPGHLFLHSHDILLETRVRWSSKFGWWSGLSSISHRLHFLGS